jgi:hypothetical protein
MKYVQKFRVAYWYIVLDGKEIRSNKYEGTGYRPKIESDLIRID